MGLSKPRKLSIGTVLLATAIIALLLLVLGPVLSIWYGGVRDAPPGGEAGFTVQNYTRMLEDSLFYTALINSLLIATLATVLSVPIGLTLAWIVARTNVPSPKTLETMIMSPIFFAPMVSALAWATLLAPKSGLLNTALGGWLNLQGPIFNIYSIPGIVWVMSIYYSVYVFILTVGALRSMDPSLEEVASLAGAGRAKVAYLVTFPLITPAILGAMLLVFVLSIDLFSVPAVLGLPGRVEVLIVRIYYLVVRLPPNYGLATAMGSVLLAITAIGVYAQKRIIGSKAYTTLTGKGLRPRTVDLGKYRFLAFGLCVIFFFLALVLPVIALTIYSLLPFYSGTFSLSALTVKHYEFIFGWARFPNLIKNTLFLGAVGATASMIFAFLLSYIVHKTRYVGRSAVNFLSYLPLTVPASVLALGMLWFWLAMPIGPYGTIWILMVAYITRYLPYSTRATSSAVIQIHKELEESARVSGASLLQTLRKIVLPLMRHGMLSGWMLLFILFSQELAASILLYTPGNDPLSVGVYDLWENGDWGPLSVLTLIQVGIVATVIVLSQRIFHLRLSGALT